MMGASWIVDSFLLDIGVAMEGAAKSTLSAVEGAPNLVGSGA
jgi:hypothetical protein